MRIIDKVIGCFVQQREKSQALFLRPGVPSAMVHNGHLRVFEHKPLTAEELSTFAEEHVVPNSPEQRRLELGFSEGVYHRSEPLLLVVEKLKDGYHIVCLHRETPEA